MALSTMIQKLVGARKAYDAQLAEFGKTGAEAVAAHLAPHIPAGYFLTWTQGTPSFNDGDPCTFSAHDPYLVPLKSAAAPATACHCGHSVEEHGGDEEFPGSTACQTCADDTDGATECDVFEADESEEDEDSDDVEAEERTDTLCIASWTLNNYGAAHDTYTPLSDGTTRHYHRDADDLPEDLLKRAFGNGARPRVNADGTHSIGEWYCGY